MANTTQINIQFNTTQAQRQLSQLQGQVAGLNSNVGQSNTLMTRFSGIVSSVGVALLAKKMVALGEAYQNFNTVIKSTTSSTEEFNAVQKELLDISIDTGTSLESNAANFKRFNEALQIQGKTSFEVLGFTKTLNQAFAVSGVNAQESAAAITQLSQALSAGTLQGDEFNSIAEQAPILLRAISDSSGLAQSQLKKLASEGKLTSDIVFKGIVDASDDINASFSQLPATFSKLGQNFSNIATQGVGVLNESLGELFSTLSGLNNATFTETLADSLNEVLLGTARILGLRESEEDLLRERDELLKSIAINENAIANMVAKGYSNSNLLLIGERNLLESNKDRVIEIENQVAAERRLLKVAKEKNAEAVEGKRLAEQQKIESGKLKDAMEALNALQKNFEERQSSGDRVIDSINSKYDERISKLQEILDKQDIENINTVGALDTQNQITSEIAEQNRLRGEAIKQREEEVAQEKALSDAKKSTKEAEGLGKEYEQDFSSLFGSDEEESPIFKFQRESEELAALLDERNKKELQANEDKFQAGLISQEEMEQKKKEINDAYAEDKIRLEETTEDAKNDILLGSLQMGLSVLGKNSKKMFEIQKAAGIANAVVSIATGIAKAQELGWPLNVAEAIRVASVGVTQIQKIKSQTFGGGGSAPTSGGGGGASASPTAAAQAATANAAIPTQDVFTATSSNNAALLDELRRVDSEVLPTSFVRKMAVALVEEQQNSGIPTGGFA